MEFGIGLGWLREEYEALGMPWERRGARTDDHLRVLKALWTDAVSAHDGEYYRLPECRMYPKPVQSPHPPVHLGGESDAALRRAVVHGDGWFGMGHRYEDLPEQLAPGPGARRARAQPGTRSPSPSARRPTRSTTTRSPATASWASTG
jgi:alkanesulfonate monooxygenase SsuD/methylene tetrahydromethanopterin reductase-like flavin-dependent oxidoreductase (luciferase family)